MWGKLSDNTLMNTKTKEMFSYDNVFGPEVTTKQVFEAQVKDLVHNSLKGMN
jgi:hypothetical protein